MNAERRTGGKEAIVWPWAIALALIFPAGAWVIRATTPTPVAVKPVHAPALGDCKAPSDVEQLHIVVTRKGERLQTSCMYVGVRGTYGTRP
jgi:hypothetical protein